MLSGLVAAHDTFVDRFYGHTSSTAVCCCLLYRQWGECMHNRSAARNALAGLAEL